MSNKRKIDTNTKNNPNKNKSKNARIVTIDPIIYCDECKMKIDDIELEHNTLNGRDVCNKCYNKLNNNKPQLKLIIHTNPNIPPLIPGFPPPLPPFPQMPLFHINNNTSMTNKQKNITEKNNNTNSTNNKNTIDKSNNDKNTTNKTTNSKTTDKNTNTNDDGSIFFAKLLNRLSSVDNCCNTSTDPYKNLYNYDDDDDEHQEETEEDIDETTLEYEWLGSNINTIDDLIELGNSYHSRKRKRHNLNLKQLNKLVEPLTELKNMIGMQDIKKIIFDQIIYYIQKLDTKNVDMLHTVIVGPPGVGKTQLTHIIAKIYNRLGFLKTDKVICAKRDDLIGEYIGQTAPKTRKVLEKALGGVLLLDEIYSLAPTSERDFAMEAIDMINMYLSEHAHDLVCVVAGYKKPTYEKFFAQNEGLARRFTHHFEITSYSPDELTLIFKKYLEEQQWALGEKVEEIIPIIKNNMDIFPNFGGDMMTLFACCKKTHSRRLLTIPTEKELIETKKKIMIPDIIDAIKLYKEIKKKHSNSDEQNREKYIHMYS